LLECLGRHLLLVLLLLLLVLLLEQVLANLYQL
jgi:hypothetical protein